jgi:branched-chain amino acid transport system permease protein
LVAITLIITTSQSSYTTYVYDTVLLACIGAIALQVLQGTAGLPSVGTAGFLLLGAFGSIFALRAGAPFPLDLVFAALVSGLAGLIVGLPALRLRALFLALATLAAYYIAVSIGTAYENAVPSAQDSGFFIPTLFASRGLADANRYWAYLLCAVVSLVILGASRMMKERSGRALRMIRQHEHVAPTLGIRVGSYKLLIFSLSSMAIGLEGGLLAHLTGSVEVGNFTLLLGFQYIAMIIIGGLDSIVGAVIGAAVVIALPAIMPGIVGAIAGQSHSSQYGPAAALIVYGLLVIVFVTSSPEGIVGLLRRCEEFPRWIRRARRVRHLSGAPAVSVSQSALAPNRNDGGSDELRRESI